MVGMNSRVLLIILFLVIVVIASFIVTACSADDSAVSVNVTIARVVCVTGSRALSNVRVECKLFGNLLTYVNP